jgi:sugar-phosphatase
VIPTLQYLKNYGIKIGLATSSYEILIETVLVTLGIKNFFDCTHSAENESYGKPHPAVYLSAAESLGVQPTRCLVIEDSFNGILAAKASRMQVVCIPEKSHFPNPKLSIADYQYETMQEFLTDICNN